MQDKLGRSEEELGEQDRAFAESFAEVFSREIETIYAGGAEYSLVPESGWADFFDAGRDGPLPVRSPLWLVDALLGTRSDAADVGREEVRSMPTTHLRLTPPPTSSCRVGSSRPGRGPTAPCGRCPRRCGSTKRA